MAKSENIIIDLSDVWKTYIMGDVHLHALKGINMKVKKGEFVAIQGPSGSGKSTMMNMVGCLDVPTKGKILLQGHDISKMTESELAQVRGRTIGFIFQKFNLIPTLSTIDNVKLPMSFQNVSEEERDNRAKKLLELVGLGERLYHLPGELSGGQQQRVAIARSLALDPPVILADEPTGNLDSEMGASVMNFLMKLHKEQKKTIVMVTHDDHLATFADRTEFLKDGLIQKSIKNSVKVKKTKKK